MSERDIAIIGLLLVIVGGCFTWGALISSAIRTYHKKGLTPLTLAELMARQQQHTEHSYHDPVSYISHGVHSPCTSVPA